MASYTLGYTANKINERLGKLDNIPISMKLLWENKSPTSSFSEQDLPVNGLSDYNMWAIEYQKESYNVLPLCIVENTSTPTILMAYINADVNSNYFIERTVLPNLSNNTMHFSKAFLYYSSGTSTADNRVIPRKIYGIKGVK